MIVSNNTIGFFGFFPAESGIAIVQFRPETEKAIDPINPVNPVQHKNLNSAESTGSYEEQKIA